MRTTGTLVAVLAVGALAAGCGGQDEDGAQAPAGPQAPAQGDARFEPIKAFLLDHTKDLMAATGELKVQAAQYAQAPEDGRVEAAAELVPAMQETWREANPAYEEAEGIVAGVPELSDFDVIIDAGSSGEDPENAVPFDLELSDGRTLEQPGNLFFLTETSLWGTEERFVVPDVEPDLDGDGEVTFGEALPDPAFLQAATATFDRYARELDAAAKRWEPTREDVFNAVVVMTPTMSEYFEAWKNSRFVAGEDADEASFVGTSRLSDIADILSGLTVVYEGIEPLIGRESAQQAQQTDQSLDELLAFVEGLRDEEAGGERFTAQQADTLGSEAQGRAEAIAGQVSQAAARLGIEVDAG